MTLNETCLAFEKWRAVRAKGDRIPLHLWQMVKPLISNYKKSAICRALHISGSQLKKHCLQNGTAPINDGFVKAIPAIEPTDICELILQGRAKSITIKVPIHQFAYILPVLEQLI